MSFGRDRIAALRVQLQYETCFAQSAKYLSQAQRRGNAPGSTDEETQQSGPIQQPSYTTDIQPNSDMTAFYTEVRIINCCSPSILSVKSR
jgi:hypothetical protein